MRAICVENNLFLLCLPSFPLTPDPSPDQPSVGARRGENFRTRSKAAEERNWMKAAFSGDRARRCDRNLTNFQSARPAP